MLRLMTHPGVGPLTAVAFVMIIIPTGFLAASRSAATFGSFPVKIPVLVINDPYAAALF